MGAGEPAERAAPARGRADCLVYTACIPRCRYEQLTGVHIPSSAELGGIYSAPAPRHQRVNTATRRQRPRPVVRGEPPSLHQAARRGQAEAIAAAFHDGADPHARDQSGLAAIHLAADYGHPDAVRALIHIAGADPNMVSANAAQNTPLFLAAEAGHFEVVRLLLSFRADPRIACGGGGRSTPLEVARAGGHAAVAEAIQQALQPRAPAAQARARVDDGGTEFGFRPR